MTFLVNPFAVAPAVKTYPEFVAHITTLATSGAIAWNAATSMEGTPKAYRTTAAAATGAMTGSSWLTNFRSAGADLAAPARIIQHALPDDGTTFTDQVSTGRQMFFSVENGTTGTTFLSATRNGFTSAANASTTGKVRCRKIIWWDGTLAWECDPFLGTPPVPYTWP